MVGGCVYWGGGGCFIRYLPTYLGPVEHIHVSDEIIAV